MNLTELALVEAVRTTLEAVPGVRTVRVARSGERVEFPLSRYPAAVLEPQETERLTWADVPAGRYHLLHWRVMLLDRAVPGSRAFQSLAALATAAREAVAAAASLGDLAEDGPPSKRLDDLVPRVCATRTGPVRLGGAAPGEPTALVFCGASGYWDQQESGFATFDDEWLFSSGPHVVSVGSPSRRVKDQPFNGLAGGLTLDLGEGPREIAQAGVLSAQTPSALALAQAAVEAFVDGRPYTLTAPNGTDYPNCRMERFERVGLPEAGLRWHQPYRILYRQLAR